MRERIQLMEIDREHVKTLFDIVVGSLDYGSGFLVDDEVEHLRAVAVALGVDPQEGTPYNYKLRYPHKFAPWLQDDGSPARCRLSAEGRTCNKVEFDPIHDSRPMASQD